MATETNEPRALGAALAAPPFATRGGGGAMHAANRHVERWAPEEATTRSRPMRSLGFVDRLVAPWIETAQRSASLRMFSQYTTTGMASREGAAVSWVFPRPWYQDELDWMAAARQVNAETVQQPPAARPTMFTTRGTFVAPQIQVPQPQVSPALPTALYEYVAPSLSLATPQAAPIAGVGYGGGDAYSSLVPLAAVQAAQLMSRAVAPLVAPRMATAVEGGAPTPQTVGRVSPALRAVLTTMLERAATARPEARVAQYAPELVTPPAPRAADVALPSAAQAPTSEAAEASPATQLADQYAEQRARIVDLQRIARVSAERELAIRAEAQVAAQQAAQTTQVQRAVEDARTTVQRTAAAHEAQRTAQAEATAERARIEERVAQRVAERTGQQRLHEQARAEAAEHARTLAAQVSAPGAQPAAAQAAFAPAAAPTAPAEVTAAIAALPPELKAILAQRPERGMVAIAELGEALRTAELMVRSTAANQTFEVTRGPRLMMPAGLGGLVSAVEHAQVIADRPAAVAQLATPASGPAIAQRARVEARMPSLPWLSPTASAMPMPMTFVAPAAQGAAPVLRQRTEYAPSGALTATASAAPAALTHVAWADRWLARFAGATPRSLDILQASAGGSVDQRMAALASAAPESIFIRPVFDTEGVPSRAAMPVSAESAPSFAAPQPAAAQAALAPTPVLRQAPLVVERFDDEAETPDDVFAQIAAAAAGARTSASPRAAAAAVQAAPPAPPPAPAVPETLRMSPADLVAHGAPSAPGAGLSAQLAASPFAPALRHVLSLPTTSSFDVRALFGGGLSSTYLAGLIDTNIGAAQAFEVSGGALPVWAEAFAPVATQAAERAVPEIDLAYVAPAMGDAAALGAPGAETAGEAAIAPAEAARFSAPLTTLRTALLSWQADPASATPAAMLAQAPAIAAAQSVPVTAAAARAMSQAMSMPMFSDASTAEAAPSIGAPGMIAERAHGWSIAQERSVSDLSFDFVPPELVLAARVYGLGPAEAAQAMRLAIAGPGQLAAMASTVDRTFVQAMSIASERRAEQGAPSSTPRPITTAFPMPMSAGAASASPGVEPEIAAFVGGPRAEALPTSAFGVERRAPRGAFLWPSATVAALGMTAAAPDGQQSMSVAALELLAAQAVAEIGTFAALAERPAAAAIGGTDDAIAASAPAHDGARAPVARAGSAIGAGELPVLAEPSETDVLGAATAMVPMARRARFDALYVALSQSPSGKSWSPAARAARALALAGRSDDAPVSAYERAATAWDVLPVVYATDGMSIAEIDAAAAAGTLPGLPSRSGAARQLGRGAAPAMTHVEARPGLAGLTARAGEALGSYVAPSTGDMAAAIARSDAAMPVRERELPVTRRAPTAAQEMVQTGRPAGRFGGGDVEIPAWFENAARKMLDDRSGSSSSEGGFSLAELTLVTAAPATQIAASTKSAPSSAPHSPSIGASHGAKHAAAPIDIDTIANEVYRQILVLMDAARARNGEPYL